MKEELQDQKDAKEHLKLQKQRELRNLQDEFDRKTKIKGTS